MALFSLRMLPCQAPPASVTGPPDHHQPINIVTGIWQLSIGISFAQHNVSLGMQADITNIRTDYNLFNAQLFATLRIEV